MWRKICRETKYYRVFFNASYRNDDMYDTHDDDFEDGEDFDEELNQT